MDWWSLAFSMPVAQAASPGSLWRLVWKSERGRSAQSADCVTGSSTFPEVGAHILSDLESRLQGWAIIMRDLCSVFKKVFWWNSEFVLSCKDSYIHACKLGTWYNNSNSTLKMINEATNIHKYAHAGTQRYISGTPKKPLTSPKINNQQTQERYELVFPFWNI